jgi:hypothetical protein
MCFENIALNVLTITTMQSSKLECPRCNHGTSRFLGNGLFHENSTIFEVIGETGASC